MGTKINYVNSSVRIMPAVRRLSLLRRCFKYSIFSVKKSQFLDRLSFRLCLAWYLVTGCKQPVPVAARLRRGSSASRLLRLWVRIPSGAWMFVFSVVCCHYRSLRRADHSSREVLPTVVRRCARSRNLVNEEAMAH